MKSHWRFVALSLLVVALGKTPAMAQQAQMTAADVAKIQKEVAAAAENYIKVFSAKDLRAVVDKVWAHPAVEMGGPNGVKLLTPADVEANYTRTYAALAKTPWDHSDATSTVCVISPTTAISQDHFRRIAKDGSVLMQGTSYYLYTKAPDGWRITANMGGQLKNLNCN